MSMRYTVLSDAELIRETKDKNVDAFTELASRYLSLVRAKASAFSGSSLSDKEDLFQEGYWGLFIAAMSFDESRQVSFGTYAAKCVQNRIISATRQHTGKKHQPLNNYVPLELLEEVSAKENENPQDMLEMRENFEQVINRINVSLSTLERKVLALYLNGYDRLEVFDKTGISVKAFDNALHRARVKLKAGNKQ